MARIRISDLTRDVQELGRSRMHDTIGGVTGTCQVGQLCLDLPDNSSTSSSKSAPKRKKKKRLFGWF